MSVSDRIKERIEEEGEGIKSINSKRKTLDRFHFSRRANRNLTFVRLKKKKKN